MYFNINKDLDLDSDKFARDHHLNLKNMNPILNNTDEISGNIENYNKLTYEAADSNYKG